MACWMKVACACGSRAPSCGWESRAPTAATRTPRAELNAVSTGFRKFWAPVPMIGRASVDLLTTPSRSPFA